MTSSGSCALAFFPFFVVNFLDVRADGILAEELPSELSIASVPLVRY